MLRRVAVGAGEQRCLVCLVVPIDPRNLEQDLAESRRPPWHTISIHGIWKWSARCAWSTMGNPMLPTLLLCAIHESSSLLRWTNVYFKCDTPDRPFTSAHYRDIQRSRSKGCVLAWQVLACPERSRATLDCLDFTARCGTYVGPFVLKIHFASMASIWPNLAQGSPVSSESPWGRADKPVGTCWNYERQFSTKISSHKDSYPWWHALDVYVPRATGTKHIWQLSDPFWAQDELQAIEQRVKPAKSEIETVIKPFESFELKQLLVDIGRPM